MRRGRWLKLLHGLATVTFCGWLVGNRKEFLDAWMSTSDVAEHQAAASTAFVDGIFAAVLVLLCLAGVRALIDVISKWGGHEIRRGVIAALSQSSSPSETTKKPDQWSF